MKANFDLAFVVAALYERRNATARRSQTAATVFTFTLHRFFQFFANRDPLFLARSLTEVTPNFPHDRHTRIAFLVNTMTEPHDLRFLRQLLLQPAFGTIRRLDIIEHPHRLLIRAAVQ